VSIAVVRYTNLGFTQPGESPQAGYIRAEVKLKNDGVAIVEIKDGPRGLLAWVNAETATGRTDALYDPETSQPMLRPGSNITVIAWLPAGTLRWQCGLSVHVVSFRTRATLKILETGWWGRLSTISIRAARRLPEKPGPDVEFKSEWFTVGAASNGPPQFKLLQPADAAPGR
jgi:hypothetical protein